MTLITLITKNPQEGYRNFLYLLNHETLVTRHSETYLEKMMHPKDPSSF